MALIGVLRTDHRLVDNFHSGTKRPILTTVVLIDRPTATAGCLKTNSAPQQTAVSYMASNSDLTGVR